MDVGQPIVVVYGEGVVEVGLGVEFGLISGKAEEMGVMRRRKIRGSGSGVFRVSSHLQRLFIPNRLRDRFSFVQFRFENPKTV